MQEKHGDQHPPLADLAGHLLVKKHWIVDVELFTLGHTTELVVIGTDPHSHITCPGSILAKHHRPVISAEKTCQISADDLSSQH
jgi:hypothetical protein